MDIDENKLKIQHVSNEEIDNWNDKIPLSDLEEYLISENVAIANGTIQENLNADMIDGKHAAMDPNTNEKRDLIGMINEVRTILVNLETRIGTLENRN